MTAKVIDGTDSIVMVEAPKDEKTAMPSKRELYQDPKIIEEFFDTFEGDMASVTQVATWLKTKYTLIGRNKKEIGLKTIVDKLKAALNSDLICFNNFKDDNFHRIEDDDKD